MKSARQERQRNSNPAARLWEKMLRLFRKDPPEDPFSYCMAHVKPRRPHLSGTAVAELPED